MPISEVSKWRPRHDTGGGMRASAAAASLEPPVYAVGGPNESFLRSDAVLVVIAITDEDEQPTPDNTAKQVYDRLVSVKGGDVKRMVFLGIGGASKCSGVYGSAIEARKLKEITALFEAADRGVCWDLCGGKLEDGLAKALAAARESVWLATAIATV